MKPNLDELEQLAAKATPGPWGAVVSDKYNFTVAILPSDFPQTPLVGRIRDEQDAAYIISACNAVSELIKMYREADDKANKAWEILLEAQARIVEVQKRVRKLEREKEWLTTFIEDNMDCEQCPHYETICKPKAPVDCFKFISRKAEEAAKETNADSRTTG